MRTRPLLHTLLAITATTLMFGCADDEQKPGDDEVGDGDGDGDQEEIGDGDGEPGDGDGEPGDGDGEPGDGDGEPGDGDGEPGDGDGEPGDGDGDAGDQCQMAADMIAPRLMQTEGGCSIVVRFNYESLEPLEWAHTCAAYLEEPLDEMAARELSDCCREDGMLLTPAEDDRNFVFYRAPEAEEGGVAVISSQLGQRSFEGTIVMEGTNELMFPEMWQPADQLGTGCAAEMPMANGYDLAMEGAEIDAMELDAVLQKFADTALTQAIEQNGMIHSVLVLAYPRAVPFDPAMSEYVMVIESGM